MSKGNEKKVSLQLGKQNVQREGTSPHKQTQGKTSTQAMSVTLKQDGKKTQTMTVSGQNATVLGVLNAGEVSSESRKGKEVRLNNKKTSLNAPVKQGDVVSLLRNAEAG